jgi:hypothetical protein
VAVLWIVARDEVIEIAALQRILLEREMFVRAQVVNSELLCARFFGGGFAVEEENIGLDALGVPDSRRQTEQGVDVGLFE